MNYISTQFDNQQYNMAIVVYPTMELNDRAIKEKMIDFTLFYAKRLNQIAATPITILVEDSIDQATAKYANTYDHILFMAAGVRIYDMSILFDIAHEIDNNPQYLAAAHILDWKERWYELHQQFILVNTANWIKAGSPKFGSWQPGTHQLPVIERSQENFHDHYTPLWIKFTGQTQPTYHSHPGWQYLQAAALHNLTVINWNHTIRQKRTYYYPETNGQTLLDSLATIKDQGLTNPNQRNLIAQLNAIKDQIWLLNSEDMSLPHNQYDTIALTASGFKFLEVFNKQLLAQNGQLIIYDFNPLSIQWVKLLHESTATPLELIESYEHRKNFKILGQVFNDRQLTGDFYDSYNATVNYFGGHHQFMLLLEQFRNLPVKFLHADIISEPSKLTNQFNGHTLINVSNIFCTDFSNAVWGTAKTQELWDNFIATLTTTTHIVGHDAQCQYISKTFN